MTKTTKLVLGLVTAVILAALAYSYLRKPLGPEDVQVVPSTPTSLAPVIITRVVREFVLDTAKLKQQRDSLNRIIRRLRTDSTNLAHRQAAADSARDAAVARVLTTAKDTTKMRSDINIILAAGSACHLSLVNCEQRAKEYQAETAVANAAVARAYRRAGLVLLIAGAVVTYAIVSN